MDISKLRYEIKISKIKQEYSIFKITPRNAFIEHQLIGFSCTRTRNLCDVNVLQAYTRLFKSSFFVLRSYKSENYTCKKITQLYVNTFRIVLLSFKKIAA